MIVAILIPAWPLLDSEEKQVALTEVTSSVTRAIAGAPFHLCLAIRSVSIFVSLCIFFLSAGAGGPLASARRAEGFCNILNRLPAPISSVMRLYRSTALVAFYEQALVVAKLLAPDRKRKA
ncbi:hypothetical protein GPL20_38150 [Bradyrhizobium cajani]|uniref:Uncharacterized protein n=1 Tax=Bradyrhizobium cajani TaxID=1928661 RepID=A0A844TV43_9BRAD|nr:hypothetical protein [Bradyrhizobium cajani]